MNIFKHSAMPLFVMLYITAEKYVQMYRRNN
jgi:hypothetical protein